MPSLYQCKQQGTGTKEIRTWHSQMKPEMSQTKYDVSVGLQCCCISWSAVPHPAHGLIFILDQISSPGNHIMGRCKAPRGAISGFLLLVVSLTGTGVQHDDV
eukprot:GHUV01047565.1.p1 GENE.GHUV01047565.1~~GHUV01047565.1.p1  ORF type:complete len:102 (+),score=10.90 GHUV01047565.1:190-495(+)